MRLCLNVISLLTRGPVNVFSKKHFLRIKVARNSFDESYLLLDLSTFSTQQSFFILQLLFLQIMRIDIMHIMSLNTFDHSIHDSHDVAYVLIDSTKTKTKTKRKQKNKTTTATTIRFENLSLSIQLTDHTTIINK